MTPSKVDLNEFRLFAVRIEMARIERSESESRRREYEPASSWVSCRRRAFVLSAAGVAEGRIHEIDFIVESRAQSTYSKMNFILLKLSFAHGSGPGNCLPISEAVASVCHAARCRGIFAVRRSARTVVLKGATILSRYSALSPLTFDSAVV